MIPMMVDDDPAIREIFSLFAAREGHIPRTAANGEECLGLLRTERPDVILLDIMMQPMDGWDTLTAIRSDTSLREIPVTMFSGKPPSPADLRMYSGWIDDYLIKPLEFRHLSTMLAEILERNRIRNTILRAFERNAADPSLIEEYRTLEKSVYLYRKFSATVVGEEYDATLRLREERLRQIRMLLEPGPGSGAGEAA